MSRRTATDSGRLLFGVRAGFAALLQVAVVTIVLGILGMHALSAHGMTIDTSGSASMARTVTSPMTEKTGMTGEGTMADPRPVEGAVSASPAGGNGATMDEMVMVCVAMLVATGAFLLLLLALRRAPRLWAYLPIPTWRPWARPLRLGTGTGPPPAWEFSVTRC